MTTSRIAWMSRTLAPWCAGLALLVSFTADAGQEAAIGASRSSLSARAALAPEELAPAMRALALPVPPAALAGEALIVEARLVTGSASDLSSRPDEIEPKRELKPHTGPMPSVNRSGKGDPFVALRPTFDIRLRAPGALPAAEAAALIFEADDSLPVSEFAALEGDASGPGAVEAFETAGERARPGRGGKPNGFHNSATPALPRAVTLATTTPSTPDLAPVTVSVAQINPAKTATVAERAPDQPDFAALIDPRSAGSEEHCLAQAIYFEARSEPEEGMAAVAQVVLNRVKSGLYADSVCGVVFQNSHRYKACQFSFTCEGKSLRVTEFGYWQTALRIAREVTEGRTWLADVGGATHYHANYVRPNWASHLKRMDKIGHHIFYRVPNG